MKAPANHLARFLYLCFLFILFLAGLHPPVLANQPDDDLFTRLDTSFQAELDSAPLPGGGYAIVEAGKVIHMAAFGTAGKGRPLTVQTPLMTGSTGKTITALAVRQLILSGKIDPGAPVTRYLPWLTLATPSAAETITIQHLLDHTSGISKLDGQNLQRIYRPELTPEAVARSLKEIDLAYPAGSTYEYSNLNYVLLGLVIEAASGQSYSAYLHEHIFVPLQMRHSGVSYEEAEKDGLSQGYRYLFGIPSAYVEPYPNGMVAAGYHFASIEDMAHFVAAISNGGEYEGVPVLSPDSQTSGQKPYLGAHWETLQGVRSNWSTGHSGANLNYNAAFYYQVSRRYGVVVMLNSNPYQAMNIARSASDICLDILNEYGGYDLLPRAPSTRTVYLFINAVLLLLSGTTLLKAAGLRTWRARFDRSLANGKSSAGWFLTRSLALDLILPVVILVGIPLASVATRSYPFWQAWPNNLYTLPDIGYTLLGVAISLLLIAVSKLAILSKRNGPAASPASTRKA